MEEADRADEFAPTDRSDRTELFISRQFKEIKEADLADEEKISWYLPKKSVRSAGDSLPAPNNRPRSVY